MILNSCDSQRIGEIFMGPCTATTSQLWLTTRAPQVAVTRLDLWLITPFMQVVNTRRPAVMSPQHSRKLLSYATWNGGLRPHYNSTASHCCTLIRVFGARTWLLHYWDHYRTLRRAVAHRHADDAGMSSPRDTCPQIPKPVSPENSQTMPTGACCPTRSRCKDDLPV